jgi:hypothetical protein
MDKQQTETSTSLTAQFSSLAAIEGAIAELQSTASELVQFQQAGPRFDDPGVIAIQRSVQQTVIAAFGASSPQSERFRDFAIFSGAYMNMPRTYIQQRFERGLSEAIVKLEAEIHFLDDLKASTSGLADPSVAKPALKNFKIVEKTLLPHRGGHCLTIGDDGVAGSASRKRQLELSGTIVSPVMEAFDYTVAPAKIQVSPGKITDETISHLHSADLIIADLTECSPIVFYGLGVRHATGKPVIHMIEQGRLSPFEDTYFQSVEYSLQSDEVEKARLSLQKAVERLMGHF